jgi:hypothetical protein
VLSRDRDRGRLRAATRKIYLGRCRRGRNRYRAIELEYSCENIDT